jgi:hypothetical protein
MKKGKPVGLDELMIVNPSSENSGMVFLGDDGNLYKVRGLSEKPPQSLGHLFLGDDGTLYKVEGVERATANDRREFATEHLGENYERDMGGLFLGDDGTLYEVIK